MLNHMVHISPRRLFMFAQVPFENFSEDGLSVPFNHIAVTGNDPVEVPFINPFCGSIEARAVFSTNGIPEEPLLPYRGSGSIVQTNK